MYVKSISVLCPRQTKKHYTMTAKESQLELCNARIEALEKEYNLLMQWICVQKEVVQGWSPETTKHQFNKFKEIHPNGYDG